MVAIRLLSTMTAQRRFACPLDRLGAGDAERFEIGQPLLLAVKAFMAVATQQLDGFL